MIKIPFRFLLCFLYLPSLSSAAVVVMGKLTHEMNVSLNQVIEDSITLFNDGDKPITVKVSLVDYSFNSKGESQFLDKGTLPRSNASWIQTNRTQIEIAGKSNYIFPFTVKVPSDKQLSGTYWSMFLVEPIVAALKAPDETEAVGIQTVTRYGVQIATHIGKNGVYELKIQNKSLNEQEDKKIFTLAVENTGTLLQIPKMSMEFVSTTGKFTKRLEGAQQRIYPDCSVKYDLDVTNLPKGKYKAMVFLDHGEEAFFGAKYDLEI